MEPPAEGGAPPPLSTSTASATTTTEPETSASGPVQPTPAPEASSSSTVTTAAPDSDPSASTSTAAGATPTPTVQMRALIVTQDASIIIGKAGKHINEIREKSGARATISEAIPHNPERILSVGGPLDAVSKAFGLIVRRINDEPFDTPSVPGSRAVTIRFVIPNARMGGVIGKAGSKIREIQEMSGARLQASEALLPGSTERILSVSGVADAVHIAVYYLGLVLAESQDRAPANNPYRPGRIPASADPTMSPHPPHLGGGMPAPRPGYSNYSIPTPYPVQPHHPPAPPAPVQQQQQPQQPGSQTQQIYIPNELVGAVIGKGGAKINEIRSVSGSFIKIMEQGEGAPAGAGGVPPAAGSPNERLVTITGQPQSIQVAVSMLYQRLEAEKAKQMQMNMGGAAPGPA